MALYNTRDLGQYVPNSGSPPIESRWVAVHNPILLEWQRKDYEFASVSESGGFLILNFGSATGAAENDVLYVNCPGIYSGLATITSLSGNNLITNVSIILPVGTYPGYANNTTQRLNYFIEVQIVTISASATPSDNQILATLLATPDTTGLIKIDISGSLQSYTSNPDTITLNTSANGEKDTGSTIPFKFRTREAWRQFAGLAYQPYESYSSASFGVNGAFQIGHDYNGNYAEYYPSSGPTGKFLTDFSRSRYFAGYPFDVSYIFPGDLVAVNTQIVTAFYNSAGAQIGGSAAGPLNVADINYLNRIEPDTDISSWGQKVVSGSVQLQLSSGGVGLTEVHYFDVINPEDLDCNGIYLQWLGALGNRSYWLFNAKYSESLQVDGGDTYQTAFDTIDNLTERANWYEKKPFKKLTIGAEGLTRNQIDGLKSLLTSTKVDVLTADGTGWKRTGVLVEPGTFTIGRGDDNQFRIEMSIVFPEQFNQTA